MSRQRILVCGATGFIGRNIAERLSKREDMDVHGTCLHSTPYPCPGLTFHRVDLRDDRQVREVLAGTDVIIQAAATTSGSKDIVQKPFHHVTDNAVMNSLILRAAHELGVRHVVFFSCSILYPSSERPVREDDFCPATEMHRNYFGAGWTKLYVEKMCEFYSRLGVTRHTVIRHSNIYGPHDKYDLAHSHVFGATVTKVMTATAGRVAVWGSGEERRDLLHVDDLVDFVVAAVDRQQAPHLLCNVGLGSSTSVSDLVRLIIQRSGRRLVVEHDLSQPTIKTSLALDCTRARDALGWTPRIPLEEGIDRTLAWYRANQGVTTPANHGADGGVS